MKRMKNFNVKERRKTMKKCVFKKCFYLAIPLVIGLSFLLLSSEAFASANCISFPEKQGRINANCWVCDFTAILLRAINTVVTDSYNVLTGPSGALPILAVGLALWILWKIGNFFINYKYANPAELLNEISLCMLRALVIATILSVGTVSLVFDTFIFPVVSAFMDLILALVGFDFASQELSGSVNYCREAINPTADENGQAFSAQMMDSLTCMVQAGYYEITKGLAFGLCMNCESGNHGSSIFGHDIPDLSMWVMGIFIFVLFFIIALVYSFQVVDFFMYMAFSFILLPMILVAWVFPITRQYTKKAWDLFLHSLFGLLALALALPIIVNMCGYALGKSDLDCYLNKNEMVEAYRYIYEASGNWMEFFAVAFISILLCSSCTAIAQHFVTVSGGLQNNTGAALGGAFASTAIKTAQMGVRAAKIIPNVGRAMAGSRLGRRIGNSQSAQNVRQGASNTKDAIKSAPSRAARRVRFSLAKHKNKKAGTGGDSSE